MRRAVAAGAVALLVVGCQAPAPEEMTEAETSQIEAEAQRAIKERWETWESTASVMDYDSWLPFWTEDAWMLRAGMNARGSEFRTIAEEFFASAQDYSLDVESFEIFVHGDAAYQIGQFDEGFQMPGEERTAWGAYFFARWKKVDGVWKIDRVLNARREAPTEG